MKKARIQALTHGPQQHFFGFHDVCPWDVSDRYLLAIETDFLDHPPRWNETYQDKAKICLVDSENENTLEILAETGAWNFHQGSRLQWLPNEPERIIYNDRRNGQYVSIVYDVKNRREIKELSYPIYALHPNEEFGLGPDFDELHTYHGYGYVVFGGSFEKGNKGITKVDFSTGKVELMIGTEEIANLEHSPREGEHHILTHITFNPSGSRVCFIDKYRLPDGGFMQRPITMDPNGENIRVLPGHVSHFCWKNDEEIFVYGKLSPAMDSLRKKGFLQSPLLKPLLGAVRKMRGGLKQRIAGQSYFLINEKSGHTKRIAVGVMTEDGHPMFSPDGKWVVTDTYPDAKHERTLILYDWENGRKIDVGSFSSLPEGMDPHWDLSEMRSDLHPRWNRAGNKICFDSAHEGSKQIYVADVQI